MCLPSIEPGLRRKEDVKTTKMKRYTMEIDSGSSAYRDLIQRADRCSERLRKECPELVQSYLSSYNVSQGIKNSGDAEQDERLC